MSRTRRLLVSLVMLLLCVGGGCQQEAPDGSTDPVTGDVSTPPDVADATLDSVADALDGETADAGVDTGADTGTDTATRGPVYYSSAADLDVSVETVTYAKALSHAGSFEAESTEKMDLPGDLYRPKDIDGLRPALLIVHGGGFVLGTRTQSELVEFAEYFASRGWVVLSIDYRLLNDYGTTPQAWLDMVGQMASRGREEVGKAMYPAVRDAKAALRWLQAKAEAYQIAPEQIVVMGGSAGAYTAMGVAATEPGDFRDEVDTERDPTLDTTHLEQPGGVAAVLDFWGGTQAVDGVAAAFGGPSRWDAGDPPALIVHGTDDGIVSVEQGKAIRDHYKETGAPYRFELIDGAGHGPWGATIDGKNLRQVAEAFLLKHLALTDRSDGRD